MNLSLTHLAKFVGLVASPKTFATVTNWPVYLADNLGLVSGEYTLQLVNDLKITLQANSSSMWPVQEILLNDDYRLLRLRSHHPRNIIDLDASIGVFSLYAHSLFPDAEIFSYEPDEKVYALFVKNIKMNNCQQKVRPFNRACYSQKVAHRFRSGNKLRSRRLKAPEWFYPYNNAVSLEQILTQYNMSVCDLLKIDVEGAAYDILYSLANSDYKKIRKIHLEYHNINPTMDLNGKSLQWFLENNGFSVNRHPNVLGKIGMLFANNQLI